MALGFGEVWAQQVLLSGRGDMMGVLGGRWASPADRQPCELALVPSESSSCMGGSRVAVACGVGFVWYRRETRGRCLWDLYLKHL